ncbi:MAG: hypothetical protein GVY36_02205 [Verrucomicrobia bacterium]|jgi:hypothetical protein|nr:hypothetical protein [Verrucomicrobiota bacterium]
MKTFRRFWKLLCGIVLLCGGHLLNAQSYVASEDEAYFDSYNDGWQTGDQSGRGFAAWQLFAPEYPAEDEDRYAGFFIAEAGNEPDLAGAAREGKAFGIFANGTGFEETVAFRAFERPLEAEDVFSLLFEFDGFASKFEGDSMGNSTVGIALRTMETAGTTVELLRGRAMALAAIRGLSTYQIIDADPRFNTRVFLDPKGAEIGITLRPEGRYDLQIRTLTDDVVHHFPGRRLNLGAKESPASDAPERVRSFALFNLNGGRNNAYFGALQVSRQEGGDRP